MRARRCHFRRSPPHSPSLPQKQNSPTPSSCSSPSGRRTAARFTSTRPCPRRSKVRVRRKKETRRTDRSHVRPASNARALKPTLSPPSHTHTRHARVSTGVITIFEGVLKTRQRQNTQITYSAADLHAWLDTLVRFGVFLLFNIFFSSSRSVHAARFAENPPSFLTHVHAPHTPHTLNSPPPASWCSTPSPRCTRRAPWTG
jgi:hypothetical protein